MRTAAAPGPRPVGLGGSVNLRSFRGIMFHN